MRTLVTLRSAVEVDDTAFQQFWCGASGRTKALNNCARYRANANKGPACPGRPPRAKASRPPSPGFWPFKRQPVLPAASGCRPPQVRAAQIEKAARYGTLPRQPLDFGILLLPARSSHPRAPFFAKAKRLPETANRAVSRLPCVGSGRVLRERDETAAMGANQTSRQRASAMVNFDPERTSLECGIGQVLTSRE